MDATLLSPVKSSGGRTGKTVKKEQRKETEPLLDPLLRLCCLVWFGFGLDRRSSRFCKSLGKQKSGSIFAQHLAVSQVAAASEQARNNSWKLFAESQDGASAKRQTKLLEQSRLLASLRAATDTECLSHSAVSRIYALPSVTGGQDSSRVVGLKPGSAVILKGVARAGGAPEALTPVMWQWRLKNATKLCGRDGGEKDSEDAVNKTLGGCQDLA
ncbi:hypothetical protein MJG53_015737 [Ovis ammon polii x Ovis aries]|uniref:Uncharacterized protein n=1 Tax=Ovis ammon polii x Ovis aries TaxID=2918886 RepID=A0ACB9UBX2_9CETA|nr:hypothetical protein MJG53_015737 [Ovis ammon polii x Ovis aries]